MSSPSQTDVKRVDVLPSITLDTGPDPRHSIIWLHGLGADGSDFVPVAEEMELPVPVRYVFPHAPMRPVTINGGYVMPAWYDILVSATSAEISANIGKKEDAEGIRGSQAQIERLIAQERQRGVASKDIFLAGFSQGGAVVLYTGLRHKERLGGIVALSTYVPLLQTLPAEATTSAVEAPIFMAHGREDAVIPHAFGRSSAESLLQQGYALEWHSYDMPHAVCQEEIRDIESWLTRRLAD
jgi:phospholipase/carboxylesterase